MAGARPQMPGGRKPTNPGIQPVTQQMGARPAPAPGQANEDDPSIASFPDLAVPTKEIVELLGDLAALPDTEVHVVSGRRRE